MNPDKERLPASSPPQTLLAALPQMLTAVAFALLPLTAQAQNGIPLEAYPSFLRPEVKLTNKERETIARGLNDISSENPEYRAGAVMLLGKYTAPMAQKAVIEALKDPSVRVRRAALVSVAEWSRKAPVTAVEPVLELLKDDDTEIRRMVSSTLNDLIMIQRMNSFNSPSRMGRPQGLNDSAKDIIRNAFLDSDPIVRRNMVHQYRILSLKLPEATWVQLMTDEDETVRITSIPLAANYVPSIPFLNTAETLLEDESKIVRLALAREIILRGNNDRGKTLLRKLSKDPDPEVAAEAGLNLFQITGETEVYKTLYQKFQQGLLKQGQGTQLIQLVALFGDQAAPYVLAFLELENAVFRLEAVRLFFNLDLARNHPEKILRLVQDPSSNVREATLNTLRTWPDLYTEELLEIMLESTHKEVRQALVRHTPNLTSELEREFLLELLIDEEAEIRILTLKQITRQRIAGWQKYLKASLRDRDTQIQDAAVRLLLSSREPEGVTILNDYLEKNPDKPLSQHIRKLLQQARMLNGL